MCSVVPSSKKKGRLSAAFLFCFAGDLVAQNRLSGFRLLFRRCITIRLRQRTQRNKPTFRLHRLLFEHHFAIHGGHAGVVGCVVLLRATSCCFGLLGVAGADFFFARCLCDAQLVEVVLHFVGKNRVFHHQVVRGGFHLHVLAARKDLVTSVLFVPLGERGRHVHLLDNVSPTHASVVGAEGDFAFLRGIRNDALLGAAEVVVEQVLEPHSGDEQEVPAVGVAALH